MRLRTVAPIAALAFAWLTTAAARADDSLAAAALDKVKRLAEAGRVRDAARDCKAALDLEEMSLGTYRAMHYHCGVVMATAGSRDAVRVLRIALALEPDAAPPAGAPPKVVRAFAKAREWWDENIPFELVHVPPKTAAHRADIIIQVIVESDPLSLVKSWRLGYRPSGKSRFTVMEVVPTFADAVSIPIPNSIVARGADGKVEYYLVALNERRCVIEEFGTATSPLTTSVHIAPLAPESRPTPVRRSKSVLSRWWFWTIVGVAAAGAAGATMGAVFAEPRTSFLEFSFEVE